MRLDIDFVATYFTEEKIQALIIIIIGIIAISLACIFLWIIKYSFFKGLAFPLLIIGILQLTAGIAVFARSPKDSIKIHNIIKQEPHKIKTEELPRIETVLQNFTIYKWIELILIFTGIILIIAFYKSPQTFWKGLGLGLILQTTILLGLDIIAQQRADVYIQSLLHYNYM